MQRVAALYFAISFCGDWLIVWSQIASILHFIVFYNIDFYSESTQTYDRGFFKPWDPTCKNVRFNFMLSFHWFTCDMYKSCCKSMTKAGLPQITNQIHPYNDHQSVEVIILIATNFIFFYLELNWIVNCIATMQIVFVQIAKCISSFFLELNWIMDCIGSWLLQLLAHDLESNFDWQWKW